jgi:hypothetical protein
VIYNVKTLVCPVIYANFLNPISTMYSVDECDFINMRQLLQEKEIYGQVINNTTPSLFYHSNGSISVIHDLIHDAVEVQHLNTVGLHIYLLEPLCCYIINDRHADFEEFNFGFYSEFPNTEIQPSSIRTKELDSILRYIENNKLTKVTVHTCDYNVDLYLEYYKHNMDLVCDDWFIRKLTIYNNYELDAPKTFGKRFICLNWRFTVSRCLVSSYLLDKPAYLSWYFSVSPGYLNKIIWLNDHNHDKFKTECISRLERLNQHAPLCVDVEVNDTFYIDDTFKTVGYPKLYDNNHRPHNPTTHNQFFSKLKSFYSDTFMDVITESRYAQPTANVSEKTTQAILFLTPFLLVAPPRSLEYIKVLGYKTFDKWWDESYDYESNHVKRMSMIFKIIDYVNGLAETDIERIYMEMLPVLLHNRDHFIKNRTSDVLDTTFLYLPEHQEMLMTQVQPISKTTNI